MLLSILFQAWATHQGHLQLQNNITKCLIIFLTVIQCSLIQTIRTKWWCNFLSITIAIQWITTANNNPCIRCNNSSSSSSNGVCSHRDTSINRTWCSPNTKTSHSEGKCSNNSNNQIWWWEATTSNKTIPRPSSREGCTTVRRECTTTIRNSPWAGNNKGTWISQTLEITNSKAV